MPEERSLEYKLALIERDVLIIKERFDAHLEYHRDGIDARIDTRIETRLRSLEDNRSRTGDSNQRWISILIATIGIILTLITAYAQAQSGA